MSVISKLSGVSGYGNVGVPGVSGYSGNVGVPGVSGIDISPIKKKFSKFEFSFYFNGMIDDVVEEHRLVIYLKYIIDGSLYKYKSDSYDLKKLEDFLNDIIISKRDDKINTLLDE